MDNFEFLKKCQQLQQTIISGFTGALIALLFERFKNPVLKTIASEEANQDYTYPSNVVVPGRWKFFRVRVINRPLPKTISWLIKRQTAQQVHARITFKQLGKTMRGRWAETLELPHASPFDRAKLANFPEPETIFAGESRILDIFAKYEHDIEAYGWNNEAYLNNWRTPHYKLDPGNYDIEIVLVGLNTHARKTLKACIADTIDDTHLYEPKPRRFGGLS